MMAVEVAGERYFTVFAVLVSEWVSRWMDGWRDGWDDDLWVRDGEEEGERICAHEWVDVEVNR